MSRKKQKVSHECFQIVHFCYRSSSEKVLSDLPDEILTEIFGYLNPESLAQISHLRIQRLTAAACFKSADFSTCNTISLSDLQSFFIEERLNLIQEINFNNVFFALPSTLTTCIVKCKNITKLYILNCELELSHISSIFNSCKALLECYWSLPEVNDGSAKLSRLSGISNSLKKFYLQAQSSDRFSDCIMHILKNMCPNVEEVCINYAPFYITSVPTKLSSRYLCFKTSLRTGNVKLNIILTSSYGTCTRAIKLYLQRLDMLSHVNQDFIEEAKKTNISYSTPNSAHLQLFLGKDSLDELPQLPDESVTSMVVIMNDDFYEVVQQLKRIYRMTGKALKHLSLCKFESDSSTDPMRYYRVSAILCTIIENSVNITVLSLSELHLSYIFPLLSNSPLKHLKVFHLCTCCLAVHETEHDHSGIERQACFQDFVLKSKKVEEFGLYGCKTCEVGPTDEMLNPISLWKELKCLTLEKVRTVRQCRFLINIANRCPKLKMVELVELSQPKLCHFVPSVIHILKKSKELVFLRINQPGFYPMDNLFWKSVESAQNLQGLCLLTELATYIENKPILEALDKLPYIHLFHFLAKGTCNNLKMHIKRIMCGKGVKIPNIITSNEAVQTNGVCFKRHYAMI